MIPSGTNSPLVARVMDPVIKTLTTGPMIPAGAASGLLDPEGIIGPVVSVSITWSITLATGVLLDSEGIIGPVVSVSITGSITLATGGPLDPGSNSPLVASYRPCDRNTDYWTDDTLGD
jgi:hypothetical protein